MAGFTYLRNPAICKLFREMGIIENFGIGLITTFSSYRNAGLEDPTITEGPSFVKCILPRKPRNNKIHQAQHESIAHLVKQIIRVIMLKIKRLFKIS